MTDLALNTRQTSGTVRTQPHVLVRDMGIVDYVEAWQAMRDFNTQRTPDTADEIWLLQHPPVYTTGLSCKTTDIADKSAMPADGIAHDIPLIHSDRGGRMTYHGPGQAIVYILLDLKRLGINVKQLVHSLEQTMIDLLATLRIKAERKTGAPGVYVENRKIAALGLRVKQSGSYHGIALNVDMDLRPFYQIDPCGYPGLDVTQLAHFNCKLDVVEAGHLLIERLIAQLGYPHTHVHGQSG